MSESYCGKVCSECGRIEQCNCPGCRMGPGKQYSGNCGIAKCARDKGHDTCNSCIFRGNCAALRDRDQMSDCWHEKTQTQQQLEAELARRAPVLGKWLWFLFWLIVPSSVGGILAENILPLGSGATWFGSLLGGGCSLLYALIILKLGAVQDRYRTAGIYLIIGNAANLLLTPFSEFFHNQSLYLLAIIPFAVLSLIGQYHEFMGHSAVLIGFDRQLSEKWEKLWKWNIGTYLGLIGCVLVVVIVPLLGILLMLAAAIGIIIVSVMKLIYLYRTAKIFRNYPWDTSYT